MSSVKKVLIVVPSFGGGGAERHAIRLAKHISKQAYSTTLVAFRNEGTFVDNCSSAIDSRVMCAPFVRSSALSCFLAIRPLRKLLQKERFDIACSFLPHTSWSLLLSLRKVAKRPAVVLGLQNHPEPPASTKGGFIAGSYCNLKQLQAADAVVAISHGLAADLRRRCPAIKERVQVIHNIGLDDSEASDRRDSVTVKTASDSFHIIACGRLVPQKDYPTLLKAMKIVSLHVPATLFIFGVGPLAQTLRRLARSLEIDDSVVFAGFNPSWTKAVSQADLFVLSSAWEGFANVLVEAMAEGIPVVSTDCPYGPTEILGGGAFGDLVEVGNPSEMARAILALLKDGEKRKRLSDAGRRRAQAFSAGKIASEYVRLFDTLCER